MKRALIVPYRYLGDTLLATPIARALKHDGWRTEWLVHEGAQHLLAGQPWADDVHALNQGSKGTWALTRKLFRRFEAAFVMNGTDRLTAIARLAARKVYATLTHDRKNDAWKRIAVTAWVPFKAGCHTVQYAMSLARLAGLSPSSQAGIEFDSDDTRNALRKAAVSEGSFYLLHPFSRVHYKQWPNTHWETLISRLISNGRKVVISGAPGDRTHAEQLANNTAPKRVRIACGALTWRELAALSRAAIVYIGVDTVTTHLAAGANARVIALFGPTDPRIWGPWPNAGDAAPWKASSDSGIQRCRNIHLMQGRQDCVPCQLEGCDRHLESRSACLESILPDDVWRLIQSIEEAATA